MKPLVLACAVFLAAGPVLAQSSASPQTDANPKAGAPATSAGTKSTDVPNTANPAHAGQPASVVTTKDFVTKAAQSDMYEIQSSKFIVKSDIKNDATKKFAQRMIDDHTKTSNELKQMLQSEKMEQNLPSSMSKSQQKMLNSLKGMKGEALATHYRKEQVTAHQKAVDLFGAYSNTGDNPELKKWAADTLPALKEHLKMAQQLKK